MDIDPEGPIPVHLLGNIDGLAWNNRGVDVAPFPQKANLDLTKTLNDHEWTVKQLFEAADDFFQSMGFEPMTEVLEMYFSIIIFLIFTY